MSWPIEGYETSKSMRPDLELPKDSASPIWLRLSAQWEAVQQLTSALVELRTRLQQAVLSSPTSEPNPVPGSHDESCSAIAMTLDLHADLLQQCVVTVQDLLNRLEV